MRVQSLGFRQANKCKCRKNDKKLYMLQMQMQQKCVLFGVYKMQMRLKWQSASEPETANK